MVNDSYKKKVSGLVAKAKEKGLVKTYSQFCKTEAGKKSALSKDEINYYTSVGKGETK